MFKNAILYTLILFLFTSCQKEQYNLRWKVQERSPIIYKTEIKFLDSLNSVSEKYNTLSFNKQKAKLVNNKTIAPLYMNDIQKDAIKIMNSYRYFSILKKRQGEISIELIGKLWSIPKLNHFGNFFEASEKLSLYEGRVTNNGVLENKYYVPKFIIMFELPLEPVSVGDTWPLKLQSNTQSKNADFETEESVNSVEFADILKKGDELIAILKYEIKSDTRKTSSSTTGNSFHFKGRGDFNITKGKWEYFEGYVASKTDGIEEMVQKQKITLTEISMTEFFSFKPIKPQTRNSLEIKKEEATKTSIPKKQVSDKQVVKKNKIVNLTKKADCPNLYSIQILATKSPVLSGSKEFKNFNYKVQEKISKKSNDIYKYKYAVGNFCSIDKARKKLIEIRNSGFSKAFITMRVNK